MKNNLIKGRLILRIFCTTVVAAAVGLLCMFWPADNDDNLLEQSSESSSPEISSPVFAAAWEDGEMLEDEETLEDEWSAPPLETEELPQEILEISLPEGFAYIADIVPDVIQEIRYYSTYNFVGERIDGYQAPVAVATREAAEALKTASDILIEQGYVIKVFDSYRPADAVAHFVQWGQELDNTKMKDFFYPTVNKKDLFKSGYISSRSGHSRGSTIDLTIVNMLTGKEVDMGGPFDFFGDISHHNTDKITMEQAANRYILKSAMEAAGFKAYQYEWWHYTLINEPYPDTYFNFPVQ